MQALHAAAVAVTADSSQQPQAPPASVRSTARFDQTYLCVGRTIKSTRCRRCSCAILPQHIKVGLVRQVLTSRYPCTKTHWYHPLCLPASELAVLDRFGSREGAPFTRMSECVGAEALAAEEQQTLACILQHPSADSQQRQQQQQRCRSQLPAAFVEVGRRLPTASKKRKRVNDDNAEYLPASLLHESSPKRRFSGACRLAVESIISAFKQTAFGNAAVAADGKLHCAVSGQVVSMTDAHVDHAPPHSFDAIVELFLSSYSLQHNTSRARLLASTEYVAGRFFDHELAQAFRDCHASFASLRILTAKSNLHLPRPKQVARRSL